MSDPDPSGLCFFGGESPCRCSVLVPDAAGLVTSDQDLSDSSLVDSSGHLPLCDFSVGAHSSLFHVGQRFGSGGSGRTRSAMELLPGLRVSSPSSPRRSEDHGLRRLPPSDALLARPEMVIDLTSGLPPQTSSSTRLKNFRRVRGLTVSDTSFRLICGSWRSSLRLDTTPFGDRSRTFSVPVEFSYLTVVLDYLTLLADRGLAYRTITLHRSVLSATLPPVDGHDWSSPSHLAPSSWHISEPSSYAMLLCILECGSSPLPLDFVDL